MELNILYIVAADLLLAIHTLIATLVLFGLVLIVIGKINNWEWVRNLWLRLLHLVAIAFIAFQSWLERVCPLTTWEMAMRQRGGDATYSGAFIAHWLEGILYIQAPQWMFSIAYTVFGLLVVISWIWVRPRPFRR